jgi:hypothetical protein
MIITTRSSIRVKPFSLLSRLCNLSSIWAPSLGGIEVAGLRIGGRRHLGEP